MTDQFHIKVTSGGLKRSAEDVASEIKDRLEDGPVDGEVSVSTRIQVPAVILSSLYEGLYSTQNHCNVVASRQYDQSEDALAWLDANCEQI